MKVGRIRTTMPELRKDKEPGGHLRYRPVSPSDVKRHPSGGTESYRILTHEVHSVAGAAGKIADPRYPSRPV